MFMVAQEQHLLDPRKREWRKVGICSVITVMVEGVSAGGGVESHKKYVRKLAGSLTTCLAHLQHKWNAAHTFLFYLLDSQHFCFHIFKLFLQSTLFIFLCTYMSSWRGKEYM